MRAAFVLLRMLELCTLIALISVKSCLYLTFTTFEIFRAHARSFKKSSGFKHIRNILEGYRREQNNKFQLTISLPLRYLEHFRVEQCTMFLQHKCSSHRPFTCFYWHFKNQRRRRPVLDPEGEFNYSPFTYCTEYDETTGQCPNEDR